VPPIVGIFSIPVLFTSRLSLRLSILQHDLWVSIHPHQKVLEMTSFVCTIYTLSCRYFHRICSDFITILVFFTRGLSKQLFLGQPHFFQTTLFFQFAMNIAIIIDNIDQHILNSTCGNEYCIYASSRISFDCPFLIMLI